MIRNSPVIQFHFILISQKIMKCVEMENTFTYPGYMIYKYPGGCRDVIKAFKKKQLRLLIVVSDKDHFIASHSAWLFEFYEIFLAIELRGHNLCIFHS